MLPLNFSPSCLTENSPENYAFLPFFIHDSKVIEFLFADSVVIEENFCTRNKKKFELAQELDLPAHILLEDKASNFLAKTFQKKKKVNINNKK